MARERCNVAKDLRSKTNWGAASKTAARPDACKQWDWAWATHNSACPLRPSRRSVCQGRQHRPVYCLANISHSSARPSSTGAGRQPVARRAAAGRHNRQDRRVRCTRFESRRCAAAVSRSRQRDTTGGAQVRAGERQGYDIYSHFTWLQGQQNRLHAGRQSGGWLAAQFDLAARQLGLVAASASWSVSLSARTQSLWAGSAAACRHVAANCVSPAECVWRLCGSAGCLCAEANAWSSAGCGRGAGAHH